MTNNTNQKRQPKGTETGGQFAPDVNAESTVLLAPEPLMQMVMVAPPTIAEREASIKSLETEIGELEVSLQEAYLDEAIDDVSDYEESLLSGNRRLVGAQRELIEARRTEFLRSRSGSQITCEHIRATSRTDELRIRRRRGNRHLDAMGRRERRGPGGRACALD